MASKYDEQILDDYNRFNKAVKKFPIFAFMFTLGFFIFELLIVYWAWTAIDIPYFLTSDFGSGNFFAGIIILILFISFFSYSIFDLSKDYLPWNAWDTLQSDLDEPKRILTSLVFTRNSTPKSVFENLESNSITKEFNENLDKSGLKNFYLDEINGIKR